jgi:putative ABC transport system permease protein
MTNMFEEPIHSSFALVALAISAVTLLFGGYFLIVHHKLFRLGLKNLSRNPLRTLLTSLATMVLVFMITLIWTVLFGLDLVTREQAKNLKLIVTERWSVPSQIPMTHANYLDPRRPEFLSDLRGYYGPQDFMVWSFYGGTMDPAKRDPANLLFFFAMEPDAIIPMMEELDTYDPALIAKLKQTINGALIGREKLATMNKRVGDRFTLNSINYIGINLEFEVIGALPEGRYSQSAIMNIDYFNKAFDKYAREHNGVRHALDTKRLNLVWLRVSSPDHFSEVGRIIEESPAFSNHQVKVEKMSSAIASFLEPYGDLIGYMKWLLVPAILAIMTLVMANAISITVRERRTEMAVMKVLGFTPSQLLQLVLGEALFVGAMSGFLAALLTYGFMNWKYGGIPFKIGFFPVFRIPEEALLWGLAMGSVTSFLGSILPAWMARSVKVSQVFARVA